MTPPPRSGTEVVLAEIRDTLMIAPLHGCTRAVPITLPTLERWRDMLERELQERAASAGFHEFVHRERSDQGFFADDPPKQFEGPLWVTQEVDVDEAPDPNRPKDKP